jgi:hypothetical protein
MRFANRTVCIYESTHRLQRSFNLHRRLRVAAVKGAFSRYQQQPPACHGVTVAEINETAAVKDYSTHTDDRKLDTQQGKRDFCYRPPTTTRLFHAAS